MALRSELTVDQAWEHFQLEHRSETTPAARIEALRNFVGRYDHAAAWFHLGVELLQADEKAAMSAFAKAESLDGDAKLPVAGVLVQHFMQSGRREEAAPYVRFLEEHDRISERNIRERSIVPPNKMLDSPQPTTETLRTLEARVREDRGIHAVWLVRVRIEVRPEPPHYLIVIERHWTRLFRGDQSLIDKFGKDLELDGTWILVGYSQLSYAQRSAVKRHGLRLVGR
ncbi:MAG: hypothetical protein IPK97_01535 [Ahniella sp.]|nr:hypothetical protein [Ahniella sp.]